MTRQTVLERQAQIEGPADPLLGISDRDCPIDCHLQRCVITERPFCGHPKKGSLPAWAMMHPDIVERRKNAMRRLKMEEAARERD